MVVRTTNNKGEAILKHLSKSKQEAMYLDWVNNFLTVKRFAQYYNITTKAANILINKNRIK